MLRRILKIRTEESFLRMIIGYMSILYLLSLILMTAHGFVPTTGVNHPFFSGIPINSPIHHPNRLKTHLNVIQRQTAVYDGAEFVSVVSFLKSQCPEVFGTGVTSTGTANEFHEFPSKRSGYITFVTCPNPEDDSSRVLGIPIEQGDKDEIPSSSDAIFIQDGIYLHADTVVTIPKGIKDVDAISTAAAALCGVHCGGMVKDEQGNWNSLEKVIVLGGGDYACFTAKALSHLGSQVSLVTTRPMALKDTPLNPLCNTDVNIIPPASGPKQLGFSDVVGTFYSVIDTLKDESKLDMAETVDDGVDRVFGDLGVVSSMKLNGCSRYISTLTKSQKLVLKEGLLFARNPVLQYQQETEKGNDMEDGSVMRLPHPPNYKSILQELFNAKIIYPVDRNENGSHQNKNIFVRGCSFPDYAEVEIWPNDSDGSIRFGFPVGMKDFTPKPNKSINLTKSSNEIKSPTVSKHIKDDTIELGSDVTSKETNKSATEKNQGNPFVLEVESLSHIRQEIVLEKKTAVLFVSAPYCRTCKSITPQFNRLARISKEENNSDLVFAKASTAGKQGKQITSILQINSVPTFVLFREGERYGEPFGLSKLPSQVFDTVIHRLENGKEWDPSVLNQDSDNPKQRTQL